MKYQLSKFEIITREALLALKSAGITNTDQLLAAAGLPSRRRVLNKQTGIDQAELLSCVGIADLVRVKGIGPKLAQLLVKVPEIRCVQDLTAMQPPQLWERLHSANNNVGLISRIPSRGMLAECIEEAGEVAYRVAVSEPPAVDFRSEVAVIEAAERSAKRLHNRYLYVGVLALLVLFIFVTIILQLIVEYDVWITLDEELSDLMQELEYAFLLLNLATVISVAIFVLMLMLSSDLLWRGLDFVMRQWVRFSLFNQPPLQRYYLSRNNRSFIAEQARTGKRALKILMFYVVIAFVAFIASALLTLDLEKAMNVVMFITVLVGSLLVFAAIFPVAKDAWHVFKRQTDEYGQLAIQRYISYMLLYMLVVLLWFGITLQILTPAALAGQRKISAEMLVSQFHARLENVRQRVSSFDVSEDDELAQELFLDKFSNHSLEPYINGILLLDENGEPLETLLLPNISRVVGWVLIVATLVVILLPFVLLGKPKHAILFLLIIPISEGIEYLIENYVPAALSIGRNSALYIPIIAAFFIFSAIIFDRFYQERTEKYRYCPFCETQLDFLAKYCSECGSPQPSASE